MDLQSIIQIKELRDNIREKIKSVDKSKFKDNTFGGENEYTFKGLIAGIDSMLTDISTLTKAPTKFIKISISSERNLMTQYLGNINTYFESPQTYISHFEALKILLRTFNIRNSSERQIEFEVELENILRLKLELQKELEDVKKIKIKINKDDVAINEIHEASNKKLAEFDKDLGNVISKKDELATQTESLEEIITKIETLKEEAEGNLTTIKSSMTESQSNEKLISSFATKVQEREKRLTELEQNTNEISTKVANYETERKKILLDASELINSAKRALNYKTAEGISASFQSQYDKSNNWKIFGVWIGGAIFCLLGTIALGIWVLHSGTSEIGLLIGRISLLPLPIIGAIFCANQYTKQKHIIEDYAYKMVLSKAIVGFSEQLKKNGNGDNNEEYVHYIKTALEEIHKDPLRKRDKVNDNKNSSPALKDIVELAEKIVKMTKVE